MAAVRQRAVTPSRPLLAAKQRIPPARAGTVRRERLLQRLRQSSTPLTTVVAPPGWGKTTLLAAWAREPGEPRRIAWLSVDESDDEPTRFWTYVIGALQMAAPGLGANAVAALQTPGAHPMDSALPTLLNELADHDEKLALVIDDYHLIRDDRIHHNVEFLLGYLPSTVRLVISTRSDPPLPMARLRARNDLTELRADDLRFTDAEAAAIVSRVGEVVLDADAIDGLVTRTEGWAAGLHLAAVTIRIAADPAARAAAIRGDDRHVMDYFADEVLARLTPAQRNLLVRTSVLERLCGELCDSLLDTDDSAAVLDDLDRAHLFVVPMDDHRMWYRCHRLFRDALRRELDTTAAAEIPSLLSRAAEWFTAHGEVEDAIRLRLAAGDAGGAVALMHEAAPWFVERGAVSTYLQLGERLPREAARREPRLCVSLAWAASMTGHPELVRPWLDAADPLIDSPSSPLEGWHSLRAAAAALRATSGYALDADVAGALAQAQLAVALEDDPSLRGYVVARVALGTVLLGDGRFAEALAILQEAWKMPVARQLPPLLRLQAAGALSSALLLAGRPDDARRLSAQVSPEALALEAAWGDNAAPAVAVLRSVDGRLAYLDGAVDRAQSLLRRAAHLTELWAQGTQLVSVLTSLAEAEQAVGDRQASIAALRAAREVAGTQPVLPDALEQLAAVETRLGRGAARSARRSGALAEPLTHRELAVLRALQGPLTQREIGRELHLSLNTVKGYTKSLYRKLGVTSRADAVARGRAAGLI